MSDDIAQPLSADPVARVIVAGATGYAGALAADLVWRHPKLRLVAVTSRSEHGTALSELYPRYRVPLRLTGLESVDPDRFDAAIVGYPHAAAAPAVEELRSQGKRVVDMSADFRFPDLSTYERWYGEHGAPERNSEAVYGLTELAREEISTADLVANPGCYPTATLLALAPLAAADAIADVVVDAKSGVSGAGRDKGERTGFVNVTENVSAYGVAGHRHAPEIAQGLERLGSSCRLTFVPHLLPLDQGELVSCYVTPSRGISGEELAALYRDRYADERFVEVVETPPGVREVRGTNACRIHVAPSDDGGRILVFAALDNLWKGASSQAIQNLNLMHGIDEGAGIG